MPRDYQCENRTSLTHFTQFLYVCLAPRLFSVETKEGKRKKKPLIAPIVAVSEETCVGDSSQRSHDNDECDGNFDSNDDPSAPIIMAYLFF